MQFKDAVCVNKLSIVRFAFIVVLASVVSEERFETAAILLDKGFSEYEIIKPTIDKSKLTTVKVAGGVFKEVKPIAEHAENFLVKRGNSEKIEYKYTVTSKINAPVLKGEKLGKITLLSENKKIGEIKLVSPNDISKISQNAILKDILIKI